MYLQFKEWPKIILCGLCGPSELALGLSSTSVIFSEGWRTPVRGKTDDASTNSSLGLVVEKSVLKRTIIAQDEGTLSTRLGCRGASSSLSQTFRDSPAFAAQSILNELLPPSIPNSYLSQFQPARLDISSCTWCQSPRQGR